MAKVANTVIDKMRLNIELADNGIIIRNPDCEDEVTLAMSRDDLGQGHRHKEEYEAIGQKIFDWLCDVVIQDHSGELIITNFDIDIVATCKGRPML